MGKLVADIALLADLGFRCDKSAEQIRTTQVAIAAKVAQISEKTSQLGFVISPPDNSSRVRQAADFFDRSGTLILKRAALINQAENGGFGKGVTWETIDSNFAKAIGMPLTTVSSALHDRYDMATSMRVSKKDEGVVEIEIDGVKEHYTPGFQTGAYPANLCSAAVQQLAVSYDTKKKSSIKDRFKWLQENEIKPEEMLGHKEHTFDEHIIEHGAMPSDEEMFAGMENDISMSATHNVTDSQTGRTGNAHMSSLTMSSSAHSKADGNSATMQMPSHGESSTSIAMPAMPAMPAMTTMPSTSAMPATSTMPAMPGSSEPFATVPMVAVPMDSNMQMPSAALPDPTAPFATVPVVPVSMDPAMQMPSAAPVTSPTPMMAMPMSSSPAASTNLNMPMPMTDVQTTSLNPNMEMTMPTSTHLSTTSNANSPMTMTMPEGNSSIASHNMTTSHTNSVPDPSMGHHPTSTDSITEPSGSINGTMSHDNMESMTSTSVPNSTSHEGMNMGGQSSTPTTTIVKGSSNTQSGSSLEGATVLFAILGTNLISIAAGVAIGSQKSKFGWARFERVVNKHKEKK